MVGSEEQQSREKRVFCRIKHRKPHPVSHPVFTPFFCCPLRAGMGREEEVREWLAASAKTGDVLPAIPVPLFVTFTRSIKYQIRLYRGDQNKVWQLTFPPPTPSLSAAKLCLFSLHTEGSFWLFHYGLQNLLCVKAKMHALASPRFQKVGNPTVSVVLKVGNQRGLDAQILEGSELFSQKRTGERR